MKDLSRLIIAGAAIIALALVATGCGGSFQSETTVLGIEVQTFATGSTPMPTARAGLIRHKDQFTKLGQQTQFYNGESGVNLWEGSLANAYTGMSCKSDPDSASTNEVSK